MSKPVFAVASLALLLLGCGEEPSVQTAEPAYLTEVVSRYPAAERVVALGDVHGDLDAMREALWLAGVVDEQDDWIGGETVVVQTGDLLDRGSDEQDIIDILERLQGQAKAAGGALHLLNGNHELMNVDLDLRYVTDAGFLDFEDAPGVDPDHPAVSDFEPHMRARASAFMPGGPYAKKLSTHPVVLVVGDTVFAHGGVLPKYAGDIKGLNLEVAKWILGEDDRGRRVARDDDSPVWSRHYSDEPSSRDCRLLDDALDKLGVSRMVVGHSVQDEITSECDEKVWLVDVGMAAAYGGQAQVLELTEDAITIIH